MGYVNLNFLDIEKEDDSSELYAAKTLETVNHCLENGYQLKDICVLVRKRKEGVTIAKYLSENEINITSSETLLLKNSDKVLFISAFLKLLLQQNNETLKVDVLSFIAKKNKVKDIHAFYTTHLKKDLDATLKSLQSLNIFVDKSRLLQMPLYELVEELVRVFQLNENSDAYLQFFMDVVLEFTQKQNSDIAAFITYFEKKQDNLSVVSPDNLDAVQIMTIHKSKGLEFPIVIFPFAELNIYNELEPKIWFPTHKEEYAGFETLLLNYSKEVEYFGPIGKHIYDIHQSQLELDNINLLYVVLTRAVNQLYIISKKDIDSKGIAKDNTYAGMFISYLQHFGKWSDAKSIYSFGELTANNNIFIDEDEAIPLKFISTAKETHNLKIITKSGLLWNTKQEQAIERGNLVHLILSKINTILDIDFALDELLTSGEITTQNIEELKRIVLQVIEHPKLNQYFDDNYKIYNERDIITNEGELIRPDRLNINTKKEVVIIDYKTGEAKEFHAQQLNHYEEVLSSMNFVTIEKLLVYINEKVDVIGV